MVLNQAIYAARTKEYYFQRASFREERRCSALKEMAFHALLCLLVPH